MLKVLHTIPALDGGGADRILYDYTTRMMDEFQFDFIVHTDYVGILETELISKGCRIFHIPPLHENKNEYKRRIEEIIRDGKYDIIHVSQGYRGLFFLYYAKKYGVKTRIAHSHMAYIPESLKEKIIRNISTVFVKYLATNLFACGNDAAKWMWGKKAFHHDKVFIMKNAIDTKRFAFSEDKRSQIRKEFNVEGKFVIGNVARFSYQKNHEFLIHTFSEIKKSRENAVLMLVGRGELESDVKKQVEELGIQDSVIFTGVRNDVPDLLNAMDVFALPSRFEGLPVILVEVQANGLPTLVSEHVTREIDICTNINYLPLSIEQWVESLSILEMVRDEKSLNSVSKQGYNIEIEAEKIKKIYLALAQ